MIDMTDNNKITLNNLYDIAEENDISVYDFELNPIKSMSVPGAIGMDTKQIEDSREEKARLAHELGHCMRGAFYTGISPLELREQHEYRADKWVIQNLVPFDKLLNALKQGITEIWSLAEYFDITEDYIKKALTLYEEKLLYCKE